MKWLSTKLVVVSRVALLILVGTVTIEAEAAPRRRRTIKIQQTEVGAAAQATTPSQVSAAPTSPAPAAVLPTPRAAVAVQIASYPENSRSEFAGSDHETDARSSVYLHCDSCAELRAFQPRIPIPSAQRAAKAPSRESSSTAKHHDHDHELVATTEDSKTWISPVANRACVVGSRDFGVHRHPKLRNRRGRPVVRMHSGQDLKPLRKGLRAPLVAVANGVVTFAGRLGDYGYTVRVKIAGTNLEVQYSHMSRITVKRGQTISANTQVGNMGMSGLATGVHLHLEVRKNDKPVNPKSFFNSSQLCSR